MSKMTKIGALVRCPKCGGESRVVWVSQDGKLAAIKCMRYHSQLSSSTKAIPDFKTKKKSVKGMVFLVEVS